MMRRFEQSARLFDDRPSPADVVAKANGNPDGHADVAGKALCHALA